MSKFKIGGIFSVECRDPQGNLKWEGVAPNLVVNEGIQHLLEVEFSGSAQSTTWFLGLTDGTPTVASGDTLASHAGWAEISAYSEGVRQEWVETRSSQTLSNSASKADFTMSSGLTVGGSFLCNVSAGTTGVLFSAGAFISGDVTPSSGDTISVQYNLSGSDDGA